MLPFLKKFAETYRQLGQSEKELSLTEYYETRLAELNNKLIQETEKRVKAEDKNAKDKKENDYLRARIKVIESENYSVTLSRRSKEDVIADWERIHMIIEKSHAHLDELIKERKECTNPERLAQIDKEIDCFNDILANI